MSTGERLAHYLLSLPERVVRSASALSAGLLREVSKVVIPEPVRNTYLYEALVENTLRFLIEEVGEVKGAYPTGETLAGNFLVRRTAGHGVELVGILTFHASPVWVLAALADISGAGRQLIREIAGSLQAEGLLQSDTTFETVEQVLDGLEQTAGHAAQTLNMPPVDVATLRQEWLQLKENAARIPSPNLPSAESVWQRWTEIQNEANHQQRSVFEVSTLMALSALRKMPDGVLWLGASAAVAAQTTGQLFAGGLLDHYAKALAEIRSAGFVGYWVQEFTPYLKGAAEQFSPGHTSLTQRWIGRIL